MTVSLAQKVVGLFLLTATLVAIRAENDTPIIGVLSQEAFPFQDDHPGSESYIAASYVKFLEGAGARVVPIWIGQSVDYYKDIVAKTNGILLPGGATWFNSSGGYGDAGLMLYNLAVQANQQGDYYPVLGICLGFEFLTYAAARAREHRIDCSGNNISLPLEFLPAAATSKLYGGANPKIIDILQTKNVTSNFHIYCVTREAIQNLSLNQDWLVTSVNKDKAGVEFISSIESKQYPFYGIQFHPEKNLYEFPRLKDISHVADAIPVSQYFAEFFVKESRKSTHKFSTYEEEMQALIYNYNPVFAGLNGSSFMQVYLFGNQNRENNNNIKHLHNLNVHGSYQKRTYTVNVL